jgi:small GTP-binding protein
MGCTDSKDKGEKGEGKGKKNGELKGVQAPPPEEPKRYKFVLIGNPDVGKTSIFHRFATDKWLADHPDESDECVTQVRTIEVNGKKVIIDLWDTAGQEKYRTITSSFYQQCVGALLLFDICTKSSFDVLPDWLVEARRYGRDATLLLVGNKLDRTAEREVSRDDAVALARKNQIEYVETSAKTGEGVLLAFQTLSKLVMKTGDDDNRLGDSDGGD